MVRVKRGTISHKKRKHLLEHVKGFHWGRKSKFRLAKQALMKAWSYAYRDRKVRKRSFRQLWQIQISAASRKSGLSYSRLMHLLKQKNIALDRKILSEIAREKPEIFEKIVENLKK